MSNQCCHTNKLIWDNFPSTDTTNKREIKSKPYNQEDINGLKCNVPSRAKVHLW